MHFNFINIHPVRIFVFYVLFKSNERSEDSLIGVRDFLRSLLFSNCQLAMFNLRTRFVKICFSFF